MARQVHRRYVREFLPAGAAYILVMALLWPQVRGEHGPLWTTVLALTPMLPVAFMVRAMVRLVLGSDELEQRVHLVGLAMATAAVGTLSLAGGFLAAAHVITFDGTILLAVFPALVCIYGLARGWASFRLGGGSFGCGDEARLSLGWVWGIALVLGALGLLAHGRISDFGAGLLLGTGASFGAVALVRTAWRWHARRRESRAP